jgi:dienelactone hydrolase
MRRWVIALVLLLAAGAGSARAQGAPELQTRKDKVGDIPVLVYAPKETKGHALVIWVTGFSGSKESVEGHLKTFAQRGYVAMSFDPYQHGDRRIEPNPQLSTRVRGNIRKYFWPILAKSAEEYPQLIDWAIKTYGVRKDVAVGGISMGGDISVTAANVDPRITAVSACVATPDWMRRGSFEPPGEPDAASQADFDRRNPSTHLELYRHKPAIAFQSGMEDRQVPPDAAARFLADLGPLYGKDKDRLKLNLQPKMGHGFSDEMLQNSLAWIERYVPPLKPAA